MQERQLPGLCSLVVVGALRTACGAIGCVGVDGSANRKGLNVQLHAKNKPPAYLLFLLSLLCCVRLCVALTECITMLQEGDLLVHFPGDFKQVLPAFIQQHEQLRRLSDYGLTAGTCQLRQPAGVGCSKLPAVQQLYGNNSGSIGSGSASVERSDAVNASSRVVKAVGAADSKPPGVSEAPSGSRGSVPVFAVLNLGQRAGTAAPVQQQQQQQRQISLVHVDLVSNQQQGITTLLRSASLTLSIVQQQQQQALEEPQQQQQTGFVPQHNSVLYNPGWPVTLPPEPPTGQPNGSLALPHVLVTDIDGRL